MLEIMNCGVLDKLSQAAFEAAREFYWDRVITEWEKQIIPDIR
jgi:hypothetical protein